MKILSISTSSNIASVSISENNKTILELNINNNVLMCGDAPGDLDASKKNNVF